MIRYIVRPRLKEILKEFQLSQHQLAKMSGVPQGTISVFDKRTRHDDEHLFAISRALGLGVEDLFEVIEIAVED